jgi:hypothetical protein
MWHLVIRDKIHMSNKNIINMQRSIENESITGSIDTHISIDCHQ